MLIVAAQVQHGLYAEGLILFQHFGAWVIGAVHARGHFCKIRPKRAKERMVEQMVVPNCFPARTWRGNVIAETVAQTASELLEFGGGAGQRAVSCVREARAVSWTTQPCQAMRRIDPRAQASYLSRSDILGEKTWRCPTAHITSRFLGLP